jgi:hypothetical protein
MSTPNVADEQWETTTPSRIWINVTARNGDLRKVKVGGKVGMKFRISAEDRLRNQDEVMEPHMDPFTNGLMFRISGTDPVHPPLNAGYNIEDIDKEPEAPEQMIAFADLRALLGKHGNAFRAAIAKLNELNLRRLANIAAELPESEQPTVAQQNALMELLSGYRPGGTQHSYRDFMGASNDGGVTAAGTPA